LKAGSSPYYQTLEIDWDAWEIEGWEFSLLSDTRDRLGRLGWKAGSSPYYQTLEIDWDAWEIEGWEFSLLSDTRDRLGRLGD